MLIYMGNVWNLGNIHSMSSFLFGEGAAIYSRSDAPSDIDMYILQTNNYTFHYTCWLCTAVPISESE